MAGQLGTVRRLGKTYGKANRNQVVHDLFDYRGKHDVTPSTTSSTSSPPLSDDRPTQDAIELERRKDPKPSLLRSSPSTSNEPATSELKRSLIQDTTLFDINSSDDDDSAGTSSSRASKRRRILKSATESISNGQQPMQNPGSKSSKPQAGPKTLKQQKKQPTENNGAGKKSERPPQSKRSKALIETSKAVLKPPPAQHKTSGPRSVSRIVRGKGPASIPYPGKDPLDLESSTEAVLEHRPGRSSRATARMGSTPPEHRSLPARIHSDLSSPNQLGLTALKLSAAALSPAHNSAEPSSDESSTRQRSRQRLIDRLDAPSKKTPQISEGHSPDTTQTSIVNKLPKPTRSRGKLTSDGDKHSQSQKPSLISEGSQTSQSRANLITRPRMTYATQRSYLSDMVDDLDNLDVPLSQRSTDELLRQPVTSNLASQLELEDGDSDDQSAAVKLKSIHELRQSGANNRFDREIDTLLEDIDTRDQSTKALRLQALMKLTEKLRDTAFLRHLANNGRVQRLMSVTKDVPDLPTSILLVGIFLSLAESEVVSVDTLGHLFKATSDLATRMLTDDRSLASIARDRKQNLSRAMINDLVQFSSPATPPNDPKTSASSTCPDELALSCLEQVLRKMIHLGDTTAKPSTPIYRQVLRVLQTQVELLQNEKPSLINIQKLETVLSLLELCSVVADEESLRVEDSEYQELGDGLAEVLVHANHLHEPLERSVLRVVVSLSNNKPRMCRLLGATSISKAAFGIIDQNFLKLAKQAEEEKSLDESKLDSVVLALGCLLNFAECDSTLRTRLSSTSPGENSFIAQLVLIFNSQVSKVDEAITNEQSQVSVAFGYLSMLLCTLSLDHTIRTQVTRLLKDKSFEELCAAAEKFFSHLRTLEHISDDDASMSTFTARFNTILQTVRASKT